MIFTGVKSITIPEGSVKKITANGVVLWEKKAGYINMIPLATAADGKTIYGSDYNGDGVNDGYLKGQRLSSSGSTASGVALPMATSGFIPVKEGDTFRIKNVIGIKGANSYIITYNLKSDGTYTKIAHEQYPAGNSVDYLTGQSTSHSWFIWDSVTESYSVIINSANGFGTGFNALRFSGGITDATIVTINQEITD